MAIVGCESDMAAAVARRYNDPIETVERSLGWYTSASHCRPRTLF